MLPLYCRYCGILMFLEGVSESLKAMLVMERPAYSVHLRLV